MSLPDAPDTMKSCATGIDPVSDGSITVPKNPSYNAIVMANWFIRHAEAKRHILDIMKLLKLLYFAHGYGTLRSKEGKGHLIKEPFEAWPYGPVIRVVYEDFRGQGILVRKLSTGDELDEDKFDKDTFDRDTKRLGKSSPDQDLLKGIYAEYGRRDAFALSVETHGDGSPWQKTMQRDGRYKRIRNRDIVDYFAEHHKLSSLSR
ncbi:MAG: DUF4065 domain-containing protein [Alphaproteobacteria bacterium]